MLKIKLKYKLNNNFILDIDEEFQLGKFYIVTGPSGSGKSTLFNIISGIYKSEGLIKYKDILLEDGKYFLKPKMRKIGYVFQNYALFPNMNVLENLLFANNDMEFANRLLSMVEMEKYKYKKIHELSGGQKQRISLIRSIMIKPDILLLDEPLSALDYKLKDKLYKYIKMIHEEFNLTTFMITHHKRDFILGNEILYIENGKVIERKKHTEIRTKGVVIDKKNNILKIELEEDIDIDDEYIKNKLVNLDFLV